MGCVCGWEVATFVQCCKMPNEMVNGKSSVAQHRQML